MKKLHLESILSKTALFLVLLFCSCSKSIVSTRQVTDLSGLESKIVKRQKFITSSNLKIKFKTSVELDGKENKLTGKIYALSDTCLFFSVMSNTLGIEVGQLRMNHDSVLMLNRIDKTYFSGSYADFKKVFDASFGLFYSLFTATYLCKDSVNSSNANYLTDLHRFVVNDVKLADNEKSFLTTIFDGYGNIWRTEYKSYDGNFLRANYSNFALDYGFPVEMVLSSTVKGRKYDLTIYFENVSVIKESAFPEMKKSLGKYKRMVL